MNHDLHIPLEKLPPVSRDSSFLGMITTQFFGAFNDNLFKQLVLLLCVEYVEKLKVTSDIYQTIAQALFAIPFVLFSGFAGFLSDLISKRRIVILCKLAEVIVMLSGLVVFFVTRVLSAPSMSLLFVVLFFMGTQSAFFGPAKYGILPEMLRGRDLPTANGVIQMTTFLAIIFGTVAAGYSKTWFHDRLWMVSGICILIATIGMATSLLIRRTVVAHRGLKFQASSLGINRETRQLLNSDRQLLGVLLVSTLFWFVSGVVLPTVNTFGRHQLQISDHRTSLLAACIGIGIAVGCFLGGKLSQERVNFRLVRVGAWGIVTALSIVSLLAVSGLTVNQIEWSVRLTLVVLGVFAGLFAVPLQVFIQIRPPEDQKGRMIGAMNLLNWIGILIASMFYFLTSVLFSTTRISWTFVVLGAIMLPVALFYRQKDEILH